MVEHELDNEWWKIWKNRRYILCLLYAIGMMNMYATRINLGVAIVAMTDTSDEKPVPDFDWSSQQKGFLLSAFFYGYAAGQIPSGVLVKYIPPHVLYFLANFVSAVLTAFIPLASGHFWLLLVFRVIMGLFQAAAIPVASHLMTTWGPPLERSRMQAINISGAFVGSVVALPLSGIVGDVYGWQWIFYLFSTTSFIWCIVWALCIRATPADDKYISQRELEFIARTIGEKSESEHKIPVPWSSILTAVPVWSISLANFAWGWGFQTMLAQLPQFLKDVAGFDLSKNGMLNSLPYLTMTVMMWTAGYIADFLLIKGFTVTQTRKSFVCVALTLQSIFIVIAAFILNPGINIFCISMSIGFGAFVYSCISVNPLDMAPIFSPIIAGMSNTLGTMTGIISPILTGYIVTAEKTDSDALEIQWKIVFFISAGIYLIGTVVYFFGGSGERQPWANGKLLKDECDIVEQDFTKK